MKTWESEEQFAEIVIQWLEKNGWEVFQEVQPYGNGNRADIVAKKEDKYWIIETKLDFGFKVMNQADEWKNYANYVSIAVPYVRHSPFREKLCKLLNIGVIAITTGYCYSWPDNNRISSEDKQYGITELVKPNEQEITHKKLITSLTEKHKTFAKAGNNYGARITPFSTTVDLLYTYVKEHNGCTLKEAIKNIKHHYSTINSAMTCLRERIQDNTIKKLSIEKDTKGWKLFIKEAQ